jgi:hypothetical protein
MCAWVDDGWVRHRTSADPSLELGHIKEHCYVWYKKGEANSVHFAARRASPFLSVIVLRLPRVTTSTLFGISRIYRILGNSETVKSLVREQLRSNQDPPENSCPAR